MCCVFALLTLTWVLSCKKRSVNDMSQLHEGPSITKSKANLGLGETNYIKSRDDLQRKDRAEESMEIFAIVTGPEYNLDRNGKTESYYLIKINSTDAKLKFGETLFYLNTSALPFENQFGAVYTLSAEVFNFMESSSAQAPQLIKLPAKVVVEYRNGELSLRLSTEKFVRQAKLSVGPDLRKITRAWHTLLVDDKVQFSHEHRDIFGLRPKN